MRSDKILIMLLFLASFWLSTPCVQAETLTVQDGQAFITFAKEKSFVLNGNWVFHAGQLLTPATIDAAADSKTLMTVPKVWKDGKTHYGTYRLQAKVEPPLEELALHVGIIANAYRIWINGREYTGRGHVSPRLHEHSGEIGTRLFVFQPQAINDIILQVSTHSGFGGIISVPTLGPARTLIADHVLIAILQGLLQGFLLMMIMYHSLLYLMRKRDRSHLFLALGCLGLLLRDATVGRIIILQEVFSAVPLAMHFYIQYVGAMLTTLGFFLFTHHFFPKAMRRWLVRSVVALEISALILTFLLPTDARDVAAIVHMLGSLLAMVFGIPAIFRQVRQKEPYALVFFCGISVFCCLALIDLVLVTNWSSPAISLASVASCIFSFFQAALLAQKNAKAHLDLETEQARNFHAYQELSKLVYPHQIQQLKAGEILEHTMPVGESEGIFLQFDIVDSSRLESSVAKTFFEKIFTRTNDIIMRDYDPDRLLASGFRVKELGDGFLCSVGFPFQTPGGVSKELLALQMAEEFVRVFLDEEAFLDHDVYGRLHCAIGVARGAVSGYFPQAGVKHYDLFGAGIILATRYEAIRKNLFATIDPTAIIIVQHQVFEALSPSEIQQRELSYQLHDLIDGDFRIRNDPDATYFYYSTMESLESRKTA